MSRTIRAADGRTRIVVAPTTTTRMAARMLAASAAIAKRMPRGFYDSPALDILLALHVAEEDACYPQACEINPAGLLSASTKTRWIDALVKEELVECREGLLALTSDGHQLVMEIAKDIFDAQRGLDEPSPL